MGEVGIRGRVGFRDEVVDLGLVEQKVGGREGVGFEVGGGGGERGNMGGEEIKRVFFGVDIGFFEVKRGGGDGFELGRLE